MTDTIITPELARRIGLKVSGDERPKPETMLDWALRWAARGVHVFPCARCLGSPLVRDWYRQATAITSQLVEWWSEWRDADVAGVPSKSGHYLIIAAGATGADSLAEIEAEYGRLPAEFRYMTARGESEHLWMKCDPADYPITSHHRLGRGLHVIGAGQYVYLPASWAPDHIWNRED
jgi:hypothetical protein